MKFKNCLLIGLMGASLSMGAKEAHAAITSDVKEVEIELKYNKKEIEINYEVDRRGIEAEYKNELTGERLRGTKARTKIEKLLASTNITGKNQDQIVNTVIKSLGSGKNFTSFKYETEFVNHTKHKFTEYPTNNSTPKPKKAAISDFEYEFKYGRKEIEIDYEVDGRQIEAEIKNELTGQKIKGSQAQKLIEKILNQVDITSISKLELEKLIVKELRLTNNYTSSKGTVKLINHQKLYF